MLGVSPGTAWQDVRRAYRALMRDHHPDRAGATHAGAAALVTQAFAVLEAREEAHVVTVRRPPATPRSSTAPRPSTTYTTRGRAEPTSGDGTVGAGGPSKTAGAAGSPSAGAGDGGPVRLLADDTIGIDASAEDAFLLLVEAANDAGEVTYIDPDIGLLETLVSFPGEPVSSLVLTLQGRADHIEAFATIEALERGAPPPLAAVVEVLADLARRRIGQPAPHPVRAPRSWLTDAG